MASSRYKRAGEPCSIRANLKYIMLLPGIWRCSLSDEPRDAFASKLLKSPPQGNDREEAVLLMLGSDCVCRLPVFFA